MIVLRTDLCAEANWSIIQLKKERKHARKKDGKPEEIRQIDQFNNCQSRQERQVEVTVLITGVAVERHTRRKEEEFTMKHHLILIRKIIVLLQ